MLNLALLRQNLGKNDNFGRNLAGGENQPEIADSFLARFLD